MNKQQIIDQQAAEIAELRKKVFELMLDRGLTDLDIPVNADIVAAPPKTVDVKGKPCVKARCKGTYQEAGIQDDMHGNLHCTACGQRVKRHQEV